MLRKENSALFELQSSCF